MSASSEFDPMILEFFNDYPLVAYYIKSVPSGEYDVITSTYPTAIVETPVRAIQLDLIRNPDGLSSKFGTLILAGDKDCFVLPPEKLNNTNDPLVIDTTNDRIRIGTITYKIEVAKDVSPDGTVLLYNFLLRR